MWFSIRFIYDLWPCDMNKNVEIVAFFFDDRHLPNAVVIGQEGVWSVSTTY